MYTTTIDEYELTTDEGTWYASVEVTFEVDTGFKGSYSYNAPSDVDYYGQAPYVEDVVSVRIINVFDDEDDIELAPWEERAIAAHIADTIDGDMLIDTLPEPEPDYPEYEPYDDFGY